MATFSAALKLMAFVLVLYYYGDVQGFRRFPHHTPRGPSAGTLKKPYGRNFYNFPHPPRHSPAGCAKPMETRNFRNFTPHRPRPVRFTLQRFPLAGIPRGHIQASHTGRPLAERTP